MHYGLSVALDMLQGMGDYQVCRHCGARYPGTGVDYLGLHIRTAHPEMSTFCRGPSPPVCGCGYQGYGWGDLDKHLQETHQVFVQPLMDIPHHSLLEQVVGRKIREIREKTDPKPWSPKPTPPPIKDLVPDVKISLAQSLAMSMSNEDRERLIKCVQQCLPKMPGKTYYIALE